MELTTYQRSKFNKYIAPLVKKERCEICSCTSDLEVHHEKLFVETLYETLEELNLAYKDTDYYNNNELDLITNIMIGKQVRQSYHTLCKQCHFEHHINENTRSISRVIRSNLKELKKIDDENSFILPYLDKIVGSKLFKTEQNELIELLTSYGIKDRTMGINTLNNLFSERNYPFKIIPKKSGSVRYWSIIRL